MDEASSPRWAIATSNGRTEGADDLIKRVKRGQISRFGNSRVHALLYAGKPTVHLLETITSR